MTDWLQHTDPPGDEGEARCEPGRQSRSQRDNTSGYYKYGDGCDRLAGQREGGCGYDDAEFRCHRGRGVGQRSIAECRHGQTAGKHGQTDCQGNIRVRNGGRHF